MLRVSHEIIESFHQGNVNIVLHCTEDCDGDQLTYTPHEYKHALHGHQNRWNLKNALHWSPPTASEAFQPIALHAHYKSSHRPDRFVELQDKNDLGKAQHTLLLSRKPVSHHHAARLYQSSHDNRQKEQ